MVSGITPFVLNWEENPPPLKYPRLAGSHLVALRHSLTSLSVISQKGLTADSPSRVCLPEKSRDDAPELMRCIIPLAARPSGLTFVTLFIASGLQ